MHTLRILSLLLLCAPAAWAQQPFPDKPPCSPAYLFEPTTSGGTTQFDQVTVNGLPPNPDAFTIEAWVHYHTAEGTTTWPSGFHVIAAFGQINEGSLPLLAVRFGEIEVYNGNTRVRGGAVPLNTWTHVAYTWDGTTNRLYVNGQETASSTNAPDAGGNNFYIGYSRGNTGWNGLIDEVILWVDARTAEEIAADARGGLLGDEENLSVYFTFDDIYYDPAFPLPLAYNKRGISGPHGLLGWTEDYVTDAPTPTLTEATPEGATLLTCSLHTPLGLIINDVGGADISDAGTGHNDGALLGYNASSYPEGTWVYPTTWISGFDSEASDEGFAMGMNQIAYDAQGRTLVAQGGGSGPDAMKLLVIDHTQPVGQKTVATYDVGAYVLGRGFAESNPYAVALGPEDDIFVVDAAVNAIVRVEDETGFMEVFATFDQVPNPTPTGPPMTDAVPTGIAFDGEQFYVSAFTGYPFASGAGRLYTVDLEGNVALYHEDLTTAIDVDLDPRDGVPVVLQFARSTAQGAFLPGTGRIVKLYDNGADTLATGLTMPTALAHAADGTLYVTTLGGQLLRYEAGSTVDVEHPTETPQAFTLEPNYPNPFNPSTQIRFTLRAAAPARLAVYDLLGREVAVLASGWMTAGVHTHTWEAEHLPSGVYLLRLETPAGSKTQQAVLLK